MSDIKCGDRVTILHAHCFDHLTGTQFTVSSTGNGWARCLVCGASLGKTAYVKSASGIIVPLSWIKRIDPLNTAQSIDADEALEHECLALLKSAGRQTHPVQDHRVASTAHA